MSRTVHRDPREECAPGATLQASEAPVAPDLGVEDVFLNETDRMQLRRLQEQNYRRTVALASAAHELKTPLAVLSGYTELLLSEKLGALTAKQRQVLLEMDASRNRLRSFIEDFLTFCSLEVGKQTMQFQMGDINACLSEVCGIWLSRFQKKGLPFYFMPAQEIDPFLFDHYKVQHVVSNLLENAWKYTPLPGTVWLSAEPYLWERRSYRANSLVEPDRRRQSKSSANSVRVTISDSGPAIPPEYHQEIFHEFLRLPQAAASNTEGTGLGLAIARRLVQAHAGKIWLESERDKGNKFCFILPFTPSLEGTNEHSA
jgi:signal transduction histidine kinase